MSTVLAVVVGVLIPGAGLYLGNSVRLRTREEVKSAVASKRLPAYASLWEMTKVASPMRGRPLSSEERSGLFDEMTDWYYDGGQGMLLTEQTRNIYLTAKRNLTCADGDLLPSSVALRVTKEGDAARGQASIDQLSLLRTSMRADVEIFTEPYDQDLGDEDVAFLEACGVDLRRTPWRRALGKSRGG
ncbi:MAG: hypothetical protein ACRDL2_05175, partial [Gaiellaceae bacterium]